LGLPVLLVLSADRGTKSREGLPGEDRVAILRGRGSWSPESGSRAFIGRGASDRDGGQGKEQRRYPYIHGAPPGQRVETVKRTS
jgi:hypothetical protein